MALCVGKHSECPARMTASPTYRSPGFRAQVGEQHRAGELICVTSHRTYWSSVPAVGATDKKLPTGA
jgi:hypothetical protein